MYVLVFFLEISKFSNWWKVFSKAWNKGGARYSKLQIVKPGPGTLFFTSFHVPRLLRKFKVDSSWNSSISFKYNGSLHCIVLWVSGLILYLILVFIGKMCNSMQIGVIISLENLGRPTTILAAQLINIWRPLRMIFGRSVLQSVSEINYRKYKLLI